MIIETKKDFTKAFGFDNDRKDRPSYIFKRGHRMLVLGKTKNSGAGVVETTFYFVLPFGTTRPLIICDNNLTRPFYNMFSIVC